MERYVKNWFQAIRLSIQLTQHNQMHEFNEKKKKENEKRK